MEAGQPLKSHAESTIETGRAALSRGHWAEARQVFEAAFAAEATPEALEGVAAAAYWQGDGGAIFAAREEAYRLYQKRGDRRNAARVATILALEYEAARKESAISNGWLRRAHRLLEGLPPTPEQAWLALWEGHLSLLYRGDRPGARRRIEEATGLGRDLGLADVETMGRALEGLALVSEGHVAEGMSRLDETTTAAVAGEIDDLEVAGNACCYVLTACEQVRDYDRAAQWHDRVQSFFRRWHGSTALSFCRRHHAEILLWRGAWAEAEAELVAMTRELAAFAPAALSEAAVRLAELRRRQGRTDEAIALLAGVEMHPVALLCRAAIDLETGDPAAAVSGVERTFRLLPAEDLVDRSGGLEILVRAHAARGEHAKAGAALEELAAVAEATGTDGLRGAAAEAAGALAAAGGEDEAARRSFESALDRYERAGARFESARVRRQLATVLRSLGQVDAAEREARAALGVFERLGARLEAGRALELLRSLAPGCGKSPAAIAGLSGREAEVLHLVSEGLSNAAIAERLFLSEHTVKRHVANILTKLKLPSRTAAAAHAVRQGAR